MLYKTRIFILTFSCYVGIHSLRTTYSFSKNSLAGIFSIQESDLGLIDSLLIYSLAIGFLQQALFPLARPVFALSLGVLAAGVVYALLPFVIVDIGLHSFALLAIIMSADGYFQSYAWPNLLMLINVQYDNKQEAIALGFWSTNANFGNILGFILCQWLVINGEIQWQASMYIVAIYVCINSGLIFFLVEELPTDRKQQLDLAKPIFSSLQMTPFQLLKSPVTLLLTLSFGLLKSIEYGIMLWLPIYFDLQGLVEYSAYIPITFDIASIFSSIALGYAFKKIANKGVLLGPLIFMLMIFFIGLRYLNSSVELYFVLIAAVGVCLGGSYNMMGSLVAMELVKSIPKEKRTRSLGFYSAVLMCVANVIAGSTQLLIGYAVGTDEALIFTIFIWYSALTLLLLIIVGVIENRQPPPLKEVTIQITHI